VPESTLLDDRRHLPNENVSIHQIVEGMIDLDHLQEDHILHQGILGGLGIDLEVGLHLDEMNARIHTQMTIGDGGHLRHEHQVPDQPVLREDHLLPYIQTELVWLDLYLALLAVMLNAINTIPGLRHPHDIVQDHRLHVDLLLPLLLETIPTGLVIRLHGRSIAATALHRQ
jgi:hypothetical protein